MFTAVKHKDANHRERLILTHGLQKRTTTQTSKPWKPRGDTLTCPLLSPFWFWGAVSYLYGKLDGNSNFFSQKPRRRQQRHTITPATTTARGHTDLKHISGLTEEDCHKPNRGPEGSSSSSSRTRRSAKQSSSTSTPGHPTGTV